MEDLLKNYRENLAVCVFLGPVASDGKNMVLAGQSCEDCGFFTFEGVNAFLADWKFVSRPIFTSKALAKFAIKTLLTKCDRLIEHQSIAFAIDQIPKGRIPDYPSGKIAPALEGRKKLLPLVGVFGQPEVLKESKLKGLKVGDVELRHDQGLWQFSHESFSYELAVEFAAHIAADPWMIDADWRFYMPWLVRRPESHWNGLGLAQDAPRQLHKLALPFSVSDNPDIAEWLCHPPKFSWEVWQNRSVSAQEDDGLQTLNLLTITEIDSATIGLHQYENGFSIAEVLAEEEGDKITYRGKCGAKLLTHEDSVAFIVPVAKRLGFAEFVGTSLDKLLPSFGSRMTVKMKGAREEFAPNAVNQFPRMDIEKLPEQMTKEQLFSLVCQILSDEKTDAVYRIPQLSAFLQTSAKVQLEVAEKESVTQAQECVTVEETVASDMDEINQPEEPQAEELKTQTAEEPFVFPDLHPQVQEILDAGIQKLATRLEEMAGT